MQDINKNWTASQIPLSNNGLAVITGSKVLNARYAEWKKGDDEWVKSHNIQYDHFRFPIWS